MKNNCRKALAALVLALAFSSSTVANAGIMWPDVAPPPPPPTNGAMHTDVTTDGIIWSEASDTLTEIGLNLLQVLPRF